MNLIVVFKNAKQQYVGATEFFTAIQTSPFILCHMQARNISFINKSYKNDLQIWKPIQKITVSVSLKLNVSRK